MTVVANKTGSEVVLHFTGNSGAIVIAGNNSVSNVAASNNETVNTATISQITWGTDGAAGGHWEVKRGANTVLILDGSGHIDFSGSGMNLKLFANATLSCNLITSTAGFIMVELQKQSDIANNQYLVG